VGPHAGLLASFFLMACSWTSLRRRKPIHGAAGETRSTQAPHIVEIAAHGDPGEQEKKPPVPGGCTRPCTPPVLRPAVGPFATPGPAPACHCTDHAYAKARGGILVPHGSPGASQRARCGGAPPCTSPPPQPKNCAFSLTRHVPFPPHGPRPAPAPGPPGCSVCACGLALFTLLSGLVGVSV
jgi:hypothetical protein